MAEPSPSRAGEVLPPATVRADGSRDWRRFLAIGMVAVVVVALARDPVRGWLVAALSAVGATAAIVAWRRRGATAGPIGLLCAGSVLLVPAYLLWYPLTIAGVVTLRSPSVADGLFLAAYLCFVGALGWLMRQRATGDHSGQLLDGVIISVGLGVLAWVYVVSPFVRDDSLSAAARAVAVSYPLLDLVLLTASVTLILQRSTTSSMSDRLLVAWAGVQLVADLLYSLEVVQGTFGLRSALVAGYPLSFVLLGAAVLHPEAGRVTSGRPRRTRLAGSRLTAVTLAALIAPSALVGLAVRHQTEAIPGVAVLCAVLFVLVIVRVGMLMIDVDVHQRIQSELRRSISEEQRRMAENSELVKSLRERQALSDRLFRIQRKISTRAPLQEVLDTITQGASELLGDEVVALRLITEDDPTTMEMVSSVGVPTIDRPELLRLRVGEGLGGMAADQDRLCVREAYHQWDRALPPFVATGLQAAMAAPVHLGGQPIGSLTVASHQPSRRYSVAEQDALTAFAAHVSLALNDARTVQAMHDALDHALHQAMHDGLTGLPNRACFYDRTDQALRTARRNGTRTAVVLFDLDRFKEINDTLGHRYGDEVLCQIGPRIAPMLRASDTFARLGGDEFCVLLPEIEDAEAAVEVARRVIDALIEPIEVDGVLLTVEASGGITVAPEQGDTAEILIQRADVAMYLAKTTRADVVVYEDVLDQNTPERLAILSELRSAINDGQLLLHVQPQATLPGGEVCSVEALVRWDHPRLGFLGPDRFIPIAEDTGLIKPLTSWVLGAALAEVRTWMAAGDELPAGMTMSVNLSTRSLLDEGFVQEVVEALDRHGVPAERLVLEVTETILMADPARSTRLLEELAAAGVRFAIDDFGTGYSSLGMLKALPVHQLKIDKSFVAHMHEDADDATIVRSVIELGHTLGLEVVAEGVETAEAWEQLGELGCDAAQGYHLAAPMPPADLLPWLSAHLMALETRTDPAVAS